MENFESHLFVSKWYKREIFPNNWLGIKSEMELHIPFQIAWENVFPEAGHLGCHLPSRKGDGLTASQLAHRSLISINSHHHSFDQFRRGDWREISKETTFTSILTAIWYSHSLAPQHPPLLLSPSAVFFSLLFSIHRYDLSLIVDTGYLNWQQFVILCRKNRRTRYA